jgi:YVTN family beta-propeller protein
MSLSGCLGGSDNATPPAPPPTYKVFVAEPGLNTVAVLDETGKLVREIGTGQGPTRLDSHGYIYVANSVSNTIGIIDPVAEKLIATVPVGTYPVDVSGTDGVVYVANYSSSSISIIDSKTRTVMRTVPLTKKPISVASNGYIGAAFVLENDPHLYLYDYARNAIANTIALPHIPVSVRDCTGQGFYGVASKDGYVDVVKPTSGGYSYYSVWGVTASLSIGTAGADIGEKERGNVAVDPVGGTASFIDAVTDTVSVEKKFTVGKAPHSAYEISFPTYKVFVANSGDDTLTMMDENTGALKTIALKSGAKPSDVAGYQQDAATPSPSPAPTATPTIAPTSTPAGSVSHLYVANNDGNNFLAYNAPFSASSAPAAAVSYAPGIAWGIAASSSTVAVEDGTGALRFYNTPVASNAAPYATATGPSQPGYLAFDSFGHLFATTESNAIFVYAPPFTNSSAPVQTISGATQSNGLAFDSSANLYVSNIASAEIDVFAQPYTASPLKVTAPGAGAHIIGLAVSGGKLYASDATNNVIDVYTLPLNSSSTPSFTFAATNPRQLAFDASGNLYVGDSSGSIDVYNAPLTSSSTKAYSITNGIAHPLGLAISR